MIIKKTPILQQRPVEETQERFATTERQIEKLSRDPGSSHRLRYIERQKIHKWIKRNVHVHEGRWTTQRNKMMLKIEISRY